MKKCSTLGKCKKVLSFKQCNFFNGVGFFKIRSLRFPLMKVLKFSIRLHWWPFPKKHDALSTHVFTKSRREWIGTILNFPEESHFFKWFNYADSRAITIRHIGLKKKKTSFLFQNWKFCWIYRSTKCFEFGSKWQYIITKLFKSVSGFVLS